MAGHTSDCICGRTFRFICCDLITGIPKAELHPVSADWEVSLNEVGTATLTLAPKDLRPGQVRTNGTVVHILRIASGPGVDDADTDAATPINPTSEFAGIVDTMTVGGGTLQVGLKSVEAYWDKRIVPTATVWNQVSQTVVCDRLAKMTVSNGICLNSAYQASTIKMDWSCTEWDYKIIGEAIREITDGEDGPDYELVHNRSDIGDGREGHRWQTTAIFRDRVGADRAIILTGDVNAFDYSLTIDGAEQANKITGLGAGSGVGQIRSIATDTSHPEYPLMETSQAWTDTTIQSTLDKQTKGWLEDYALPVSTPGAVLRGLDPDPSLVRVGDTVSVNVEFGVLNFRGTARVKSISWNLSDGEAVSRTLDMVPEGAAALDSIYSDEDPRWVP